MGRLKEAMMAQEYMNHIKPRELIVQIKNVYGSEKIYPYCEDAKTFCKLLGQTTLTDINIKYIKELGYTLTVNQTVATL